MKKLLFVVLLGLVSCEEPRTTVITSDGNVVKESNFKRLEERIPIKSGYVSVYSYGTDTLYIVEGVSSSYPVGISVK